MGYEKDQTPLPQKGDLSVVLDGSGDPVLVIETIDVVILPFNEVSEQFTFEEGEGDRSIAYRRMAHENYFRRNHFEDRAFDDQMLGEANRTARLVAYWTNPSRRATASDGAFASSVRYCGTNVRSKTISVSVLTAVVAWPCPRKAG